MSVQSQSSKAEADNPFRHADELAHQLVRHLGISAARKTCNENQWVGVLDAINRLHKAD